MSHQTKSIIKTKRRHLYKEKGTSTVPSINHIRSLVFTAVLIACDFLVGINPVISIFLCVNTAASGAAFSTAVYNTCWSMFYRHIDRP